MDSLNPNTIFKSVYVPNQHSVETAKSTQQSVGSVPSLVNLMDGHMSFLALNAGHNISVCCAVNMPGPSSYQMHSHYYYHRPSLPLLVLFSYQLPSPVCCPTLSAQLTTCVSPKGTHTFSLASPHTHTAAGCVQDMAQVNTAAGCVQDMAQVNTAAGCVQDMAQVNTAAGSVQDKVH